MKIEKAEKLDKILEVMNTRDWLTRIHIKEKIEQLVNKHEMDSISIHKYKDKPICISKIEKRRRWYKLTVAGTAFKKDESFKAEVEKELREIEQVSDENRLRKLSLRISLASVLIALGALIFVIIGTCSRDTNYNELERRIDSLEKQID